MTRRVVIVAFEGFQSLDAVGPFEVFAGANEVQQRRTGRSNDEYALVIAGDRSPIRSESGLCIVPSSTLMTLFSSRAPRIDTLIVAGGAGARRASKDPALVKAVRKAASHARRVASVCTGAFVLAAAGLLDGRRATTHWAACDALASSYPKVQVEREPIFIREHDGALWTSAGVTAGIDLALAMIEEDFGRELAMIVARWLVVFIRRSGGQAQFSVQLAAQAAERAPIRDLQAWIAEHPDRALALPDLAERARMSVRNFSRVFRSEVGVSPAAYVERVRVEAARRQLEMTTRSVEEIASGAGFGTPEALRRAFARRVGLSPKEYRARFGANAKQRKGASV